METKIVYFLGAEHTIPCQLRGFVKLLNYFECILNDELMPLLLQQIKKKEWNDDGNSFSYYELTMKSIGEKVISKLAEQNVFDVTLQELVYRNKGYLMLKQVCHETLEDMRQILIDSMNEWEAAYNSAYTSTTSNITGMNFSIWTNSLSSALLYTAMEASTIKKQTNVAEKEFRSAMSALNKSTTDRQEQRENDILANKYYPKVAESLSLFVSKLTEIFIRKLENAKLFEAKSIKKYSLCRSSEILNNIKLVQNKKEILTLAFICCPYNPDIYHAVIHNDLIDYDTFETAKYLLQHYYLTDEIKKYCIKNSNDFSKISEAVKVYSSYSGKSKNDALKEIYKDKLNIIKKHFTELRLSISNKRDLINWITKHINNNAVDFVNSSQEKIRQILKREIYNIDVSQNTLNLFFDNKLLSFSELAEETPFYSLSEIFDYYYVKIEKEIIEYHNLLSKHIKELLTKISDKKIQFEYKSKKYNQAIIEYHKKEKELRSERDRLSVFAFSKKKDLDNKIATCVSERESFEKSNNPYKLGNEIDILTKQSKKYI